MKKVIKWFFILIAIAALGLFGMFKYMISETKKASPEETVTYNKGDTHLSVFYNRPSKRGRSVFGELVPYDNVWRTGANEATTFETDKTIRVMGKLLPAGKYSLYTIPGRAHWEVIFNSKEYFWGIKMQDPTKVSLDRTYDVLVASVEPQNVDAIVEMLTIRFEDTSGLYMVLTWDQTKVALPIHLN